uniref:Uncharacterized protein n=1 Tax=Ditylenchus dipsaci TaxID=166011 RepID=A0A915E292_9BILA
MSHAQTNNVEEHKRVSFGGEQKMMIVYDDGLTDDYSLQHASKHNTSFTESDAPPNKVKVTSENSEIPRPISPPAQVDDHHNQSINYMAVTSPPLPALLKKKENEGVENPFRPTETLYHEVDPIVEAYLPPHSSSPLNHGYLEENSASSTKFTTNEISYESTPIKPNKGSKKSNGRNSRTSSLAEARTPSSNAPLVSANDSVLPVGDIPPPTKLR